MITRRFDPAAITSSEIGKLAEDLNQGKVIVYPTDTVYGLGGDAAKQQVIDRIFRIKKRDRTKALIVLVSSLAMARQYCRINRAQMAVVRELWQDGQRPTTFILPAKGILPAALSGQGQSLAIRRPQSVWLIKLIKALGRPLISTSLNISGQPPVNDVADIGRIFRPVRPDIVLDAGVCRKVQPSRLIRLGEDGRGELIR